MIRSTVLKVALLVMLVAAPCSVLAAGGPIELTPTIGYRWGGEILAEDNLLFDVDVDVEESASYGLVVDIPITPALMIELMADRQSTDLGQQILFEDTSWDVDTDITYYHVGVLYQWNLRTLSPFVVGSVGITSISVDLPGVADETRFSAGIGGGFKVDINQHFGFRFEARGFWTNTDDGDWCHDGCWDDWSGWDDHHGWHGDDDLIQGQVKVGAIIRF